MGNIFSGGVIFKKTNRDCLGRPIKTVSYTAKGNCFNGGISKSTKYYDRECT